MKVVILGYGEQGISAYEYWKNLGNDVTIRDSRQDIITPQGADISLGPDFLKDLDNFDLIIRSPSIHPRDIVAANSVTILDKVSSNTNEFFRSSPTKNIIGVTGTKGKGTTSTLIAKLLEKSGKRVHLGGNIGIPPLELLKNDIRKDDWVVLELANFQLIDLRYSPLIAVCLMVVPEHLNWHTDMDEYIQSKVQLFEHQQPDDIAIYFDQNDISKKIASYGKGRKVPYFKEPGAYIENGAIKIDNEFICQTDDLQLLGKHNWQNVCAAVTAVWQVVQNTDAIQSILTTFTGLEHRLEFVRDVSNVKYYDDSFGTTPETAIVAIEAFSQPKVIILGGSDKGAQYDDLALALTSTNMRRVVLIGETAPSIEKALRAKEFDRISYGGKTMEDIVHTAQNATIPGDVVLLSAACASFDMFKNYKDRAEQFITAVQSL